MEKGRLVIREELHWSCDPVAFSRIEAESFPKPWPAASFREGDDRVSLALWRGAHCLTFLYLAQVLDEAEILRVATLPNHRRNGHAERLLRAFIDRAPALGIDRLFLEVSADNQAAIRFYRKMAFEETGRRAHYYGPDIHALTMTRTIG